MKSATQARDNEFIRICLEIISRNKIYGQRVSLMQVIDEAIYRRPRCHYASYDYASRIMHNIDKIGTAKIRRRITALKWLEIYNQVTEAMQSPQKLPFDKALTFVLNFRRPSRFYIDHSRALNLLTAHLRLRI